MADHADLVLHSGRVFTGTGLDATATTVAVAAGRVVAVGTQDEVRSVVGPATDVVDLAGRLVVPGFTDAHVHPVMGGVERLGCDLSGVRGAREAVEAVARYAAAHRDGWITGGGWSMADFAGGTPRKEDLDAVVGHRPVHLLSADHHSAWVSSAALELAGVTLQTPDPADGRVERGPDGSPTGTLHEGAVDLVTAVMPPRSAAALREGLAEGQRYLHSLGVTGWQDAIVGEYAGYPDSTGTYLDAVAAGTLTARVVGALWWPRGQGVQDVDRLVQGFLDHRERVADLVDDAGSDRFRTTSVKIMVDGVVENRTAALLSPYLDGRGGSTGESGLSYLDRDLLLAAVPALDAAGFDVHLHVVGDRAVRDALDAIARCATGSRRGRHQLAHLQVVHPDDVARLAELGVAADVQAVWACADGDMTELTLPFLGPDRSGHQYPFAGFLSAGTRLVMGSDWPVSSPDPWQAIHVAVNRTPPGDPGAAPFLPEQAISLTAALTAYTAGSAWVNRHVEGGAVRVGATADLAVCSTDPFALDPEDLHEVGVDLTFVGGHLVHEHHAAAEHGPR